MTNKLSLGLKALFRKNSAAAASGAGIPLLNAEGEVIGSDTIANIGAQLEKKRINGQPRLGSSVFIATVESDYYRFWLPEYFATSNAANAVGVMVKDGDNHIIIAKNYAPSTMKWSTSNVSGGSGNLGREDAFKDHAGRSKTATVVNTLGDNAPAAKFCANYYPSNMAENNALFGKGRWWMPAAGDLWMMYQHFNEINYALNLINGEQLVREAHWSITEHSSTHAWLLIFNYGSFNYTRQSSYSFRVRPVSAFY